VCSKSFLLGKAKHTFCDGTYVGHEPNRLKWLCIGLRKMCMGLHRLLVSCVMLSIVACFRFYIHSNPVCMSFYAFAINDFFDKVHLRSSLKEL
jgi:hypothetical protein